VSLVRCPKCGEEHDLWESEVGFELPDKVFALSQADRQQRAKATSDLCVLDGREHFIRVVLLVPVRGEGRAFGWGVWAKVSPEAYAHYRQSWNDPEQGSAPPFPGELANALPACGAEVGLPVQVQLQSPKDRPTVTVADPGHPLARAQQSGVYPERVLEWISEYLH
jgi:hypothetical protein